MKTLILATALSLSLVGCSTPALKKFDEIRVGMEKTDVIELAGSPVRSSRSDGSDVWTYRFWTEQKKWEERIVILKESFVTYVGKPLTRETLYQDKTESCTDPTDCEKK